MKTTKKTVFIAIACIALCACETQQDRQELYAAWCKINDCETLSLDEWQKLRDHYMLPGMDAKRAADSADTAAMMATMAATQAAINS